MAINKANGAREKSTEPTPSQPIGRLPQLPVNGSCVHWASYIQYVCRQCRWRRWKIWLVNCNITAVLAMLCITHPESLDGHKLWTGKRKKTLTATSAYHSRCFLRKEKKMKQVSVVGWGSVLCTGDFPPSQILIYLLVNHFGMCSTVYNKCLLREGRGGSRDGDLDRDLKVSG